MVVELQIGNIWQENNTLTLPDKRKIGEKIVITRISNRLLDIKKRLTASLVFSRGGPLVILC